MIGLEIDLKKIVRAGRVILFAAGGQLIGGCLLGLGFFMALGLSILATLYPSWSASRLDPVEALRNE